MIPATMERARIICRLLTDFATFLWLFLRPRRALVAENLFLRKQLAMYRERGVRPRRTDPSSRVSLVLLSMCFDWREALFNVTPQTFVRWHRQGFRLFWAWKSRPGRRAIPRELQALIRRMARENPTWGQERIANELLIKLGLRISPRTVAKYVPKRPPGSPRGDQRWSTFLHNHAEAIVACDFFVAITGTFQLLYVFVIMEHGSRRLVHYNVTKHPTAQWTLQQLREAIPSDHPYRFLIHDRDSIFSPGLDRSIRNLGLRVLKTPYRSPRANAICERLVGTIRLEALDWMIPLSENHLRRVLKRWATHDNEGRPRMSLGPGVPDSSPRIPVPLQSSRHSIRSGCVVTSRPVLGGLHHEYALLPLAA